MNKEISNPAVIGSICFSVFFVVCEYNWKINLFFEFNIGQGSGKRQYNLFNILIIQTYMSYNYKILQKHEGIFLALTTIFPKCYRAEWHEEKSVELFNNTPNVNLVLFPMAFAFIVKVHGAISRQFVSFYNLFKIEFQNNFMPKLCIKQSKVESYFYL